MWRNEGFYGESRRLPGVGIEMEFVFVGNGRAYEMCTRLGILIYDVCGRCGFSKRRYICVGTQT